MARLPTRVLLLAAALALAASAAAAAEAPERKVRVTVRYADEEEARWLDRWAETHQPLGSRGGRRFTLKPATAEVSAWLDRLSGAGKRATEARDGVEVEGATGGGGGGRDDGSRHLEFDHDDTHGGVIQAFLAHLARLSEDRERSKAQEEDDTGDL